MFTLEKEFLKGVFIHEWSKERNKKEEEVLTQSKSKMIQ